MNAKKCDQPWCKKYYDPYGSCTDPNKIKPNSVTLNFEAPSGKSTVVKRFDLCPECMDKLIKFLEGVVSHEENTSQG